MQDGPNLPHRAAMSAYALGTLFALHIGHAQGVDSDVFKGTPVDIAYLYVQDPFSPSTK